MLITKFHKAAAYLLAILLMISLFCLPAFALPGESEGETGNETALTTTDDITGTTANDGIMGENDGITGENSDGTLLALRNLSYLKSSSYPLWKKS